MIFGAFFPLMLVLVLGLLLAVIVIVREIRKIIGASEETGSQNPPVSLGRESLSQKNSPQYKTSKHNEPEQHLQENRNEGNTTGGAVWRW